MQSPVNSPVRIYEPSLHLTMQASKKSIPLRKHLKALEEEKRAKEEKRWKEMAREQY